MLLLLFGGSRFMRNGTPRDKPFSNQILKSTHAKKFIYITCCGLGIANASIAYGDSHLNDHFTLYGDFLFMRRGDIHNHTLVLDANKFQCPGDCPDFTVINNRDLARRFRSEPGGRVGFIYMSSPRNSFEWNFLYLQPWESEKVRRGAQSLSFPFASPDYSNDFTNASEARAKYESHLWDLEFNFWRHFNPRNIDYFCLSGIVGLRYFHWDESFRLTMLKPPDKSSYNIHTENRILGIQLGLDLQINPMHWMSWDAYAKVGGFVNHTEQEQFLGDLDNTITLRDSERIKRQTGIYTDTALQLSLRCFEHLYVRIGYEAMFFTGLALAPEQVSAKVDDDAGKKDRTHGNALVYGLYSGLVWSF